MTENHDVHLNRFNELLQYIAENIFSSVSPRFLPADCFVMAALRSRCGHYIFALWFLLLLLLSFFSRLISAVADWISPILPHMVWPQCEFKMQV